MTPDVTPNGPQAAQILAADGEAFAPGAFARTVGQVVPLKIGDRVLGLVRITAAEVSDDGRSALLTYESAPDDQHDSSGGSAT